MINAIQQWTYPTNIENNDIINLNWKDKMAGRFEGLSDLEWKLFEDVFSNQPITKSR